MKQPIPPKRWLGDKNAIDGQLWDWYNRLQRYASEDGKLDVLDRYIDEFLGELEGRDPLGTWDFPYDHNLRKLRAYSYRKAFRYHEALEIFSVLQRQNPKDYHLVEDCIYTYLAMGDHEGAAKFLNQQPISLIATEESSPANHLLQWMKKYPEFSNLVSSEIVEWARANGSD